jgi:hypothetical protein
VVVEMEVVEVKRTMVLGFESERMNEVEVKVAKIVCTKGHKVIESKKRSLNDCQNSLHA